MRREVSPMNQLGLEQSVVRAPSKTMLMLWLTFLEGDGSKPTKAVALFGRWSLCLRYGFVFVLCIVRLRIGGGLTQDQIQWFIRLIRGGRNRDQNPSIVEITWKTPLQSSIQNMSKEALCHTPPSKTKVIVSRTLLAARKIHGKNKGFHNPNHFFWFSDVFR